jgi:hypothetical protein
LTAKLTLIGQPQGLAIVDGVATFRIVAKVEGLFAQAAAVARAVEVARRRADAKRVDQAILARAFRGEL